MNRHGWKFVPAALLLAGCVGYGYPGDGYSSGGGYYGGGYGDGYGGGYGDGYGGGDRYDRGDGTLRCKSDDFRYRHCSADTRGGVRLVRRISQASCVEGRTWGSDRNGVWVNQGCDAEFQLGRGGGGGDWGGGGQWSGGGGTVRCKSDDFRYRHCGMETRRGVRLVRRISQASCVEGRTWGTDRNGVWVNQGCDAEFQSGGGGGGGWSGGGDRPGGTRTIRCKSDDFRYRHCSADTGGGVRLVRRISKADCVRGRSWGYDRNGVWVNEGCDAEFSVGR